MHFRCAALILSLGLPLLAQQTASGKTDSSDPFHIKTSVVVTATRTQTELEQAPAATSLVTRQEMQMRNIQMVDRALDLAEGVYPIRAKGPADTLAGVGMRGFSGRGGAQSRVLVLLDGQPMNDAYTGGVAWSPLPVNEMERVEVARGPYSALYGGNAMGGVVNLLTRPFERRQIETEAEYGTWNTMIYSARYSDRFFDRLGLTLGYRRLQSGGYENYPVLKTARASTATGGIPVTGAKAWLTPTGGQTFELGRRGENWWNQHSWRGRAQYTFSPSTTASFQVFSMRSQYGYDQGVPALRDANGNPVYAGNVVFLNNGQWLRATLGEADWLNGPGGGESYFFQGQLHHSFRGASRLQLIWGLLNSASDWYVTPAASARLAGGPGAIAERPNRGHYGNAQYSLPQKGMHSFVFGAESRWNTTDAAEYSLALYGLRETRQQELTTAYGKAFNQAFYVQDQIAVNPRLQLVLGGRYDYWKAYDGVSMPAAGAAALRYPERSSHSMNGKLSILYRLTESTIIYGNTANAFRSPTVFELYRTYRLSSGNLYVANPSLEPERMISWEGGLRQRFTSWWQTSATYFENRIENLIYRTTDLAADPTGRTRPLVNAGKGFTKGVEAASTVRLRSWAVLKTTYTYNDAVISENTFLPETAGKRVPFVPKHMGTFGILGSGRRFSGSFTGRYVGSAYRSDVNDDFVRGVPGSYDPFFELDLTGGYEIGRYATLYAGVNNLLDRRYWMFYLNPGRTMQVGLRLRVF